MSGLEVWPRALSATFSAHLRPTRAAGRAGGLAQPESRGVQEERGSNRARALPGGRDAVQRWVLIASTTNIKPKPVAREVHTFCFCGSFSSPKRRAAVQTCFILVPSLGGQVFGRNDVSFTDGKFGT